MRGMQVSQEQSSFQDLEESGTWRHQEFSQQILGRISLETLIRIRDENMSQNCSQYEFEKQVLAFH